MNLYFEPAPPEGWRIIIDIPEKNKKVHVGHLRRKGKEQWRMVVGENAYDFEAKDLTEAHAHLNEKLQIARGLPECLKDESMSTYVDMHLHVLNSMASRTDSMRGWVSGIGAALGRFLAEDLPDGAEHENRFWSHLRQAAEGVRDQLQQQEALKGDLETVLRHMHQAIEPKDEDPPKPPPMH